jgi:hypothetical protein
MAENEKIKKTLILDSESIFLLESFAKSELGSTNLSAAVRVMTRVYLKDLMKKQQSRG